MYKIFLALLIFIATLVAQTPIERFDKSFDGAPKSVKIKLHDEMKRIYMNAIINDDKATQRATLTRLIKSSKAMGLNALGYEADLRSLGGSNSQKTNSQTTKKATQAPIYLLSASKNSQTLDLKFNQDISADMFKIYPLNIKGKYRNIIDIKGILNGKGITYKNFITEEIRINQFDKSTIRIVFSDTAQKGLEARISGQTLIVSAKNFISNENINQGLKRPKDESKKEEKQQTSKSDNQTYAPARAKAIGSKTIVIDPGHGGKDPGAIGGDGKYKEKVAVLAVSKKLAEELKKQGHKVYFTRSTDIFINLRSRTKFANDKFADLFISVHANAAPNAAKAKTMHGIETFFLSPARSERSKNAAALENKSDIEEMNYFQQQTFLNILNREKIIASNKLAIDIHRETIRSVGAKYKVSDGGVREAPFWVLVGALMPAVLVEIGYITHPTEGANLYNESYQNALAAGIARGVGDYFKNNP